MRSVGRLLVVVVGCCLAAGCGTQALPGTGSGGAPADAGAGSGGGSTDAGSGGGGSGGGSTDAGSGGGSGGGATDAGSGGGSGGGATDAGSGGGATDAGSGGGSADGGGGGDGGTVASDCAGLAPSALPTMVAYQKTYSNASQANFCGLPIGDGNGYLALETFNGSHPSYTVLNPAGLVTGGFGFWHGQAWPKPVGFTGYGGSSTQQMVAVENFDESGHTTSSTGVNGSAVFAPEPSGGLFAVGRFNPGGASSIPPDHPVVEMFNADASVRYGPIALGTDATVFGAGVDLLGRAVVIVDGSATFGAGSIAAFWFAYDGTPMTGLFQALTGFVAGPSTWFETSALIGNGLALRRMDSTTGSFTEERRTSQWLALLPSGQAHSDPAPGWLTSRPNTNMQFARSRLAYAFSPWAADVSSCAQQVEVVSPAGNSCSTQTFAVDGSACTTRELRLGLDGTVAQMLPASREQNQPAGSTVYTCTLRYWPGALR